ncbi:MAG: HAD family hydrolase [Balneolaceae bacterium]|nr:MAG: HAD family hydrolase [Balneolaceae bacterium]
MTSVMKNTMVSVDFWDTLVRADSNGEKRTEARINALREVSRRYEKEPTEEAIREARAHVSRAFDDEWFGKQRTQSTRELVQGMLDALAIPAKPVEVDDLTEAFRESLFQGPPELAEGIKEALASISIYFPLAIISDTMFSPGSVIRRYLDQMDVLQYFDAFAFSDELGVSKPHRKAFETVLKATDARPERSWHVGDMLKTDIRGAKKLGMHAILYTGFSGGADTDSPSDPDSNRRLLTDSNGRAISPSDDLPSPDFVCASWENVSDILISELV